MTTLILRFMAGALAALVLSAPALSPRAALAAADMVTVAATPWQETEQTSMRLISATETIGGARQLRFGLHFKMKPGWKIYWRSAGDAGYPPRPDWSGSKNLKSASIQWPAPERFSVLGLETLGYKHEVVLPLAVEVNDPGRPIEIRGAINYLTCDDICIPYDAAVRLTIPPGPIEPSPYAHLIGRYQSAVPGPGERHGLSVETAETWTQGTDTWLRVTARASAPFIHPDIYAEGPDVVSFSKPAVSLARDGLRATMDIRVFGAAYLDDEPKGSLLGRTLTLTLVDAERAAETRLQVNAAGGGAAIGVILLLAVLGGLILNLMPCVLPVLSIKLLSVVGHGGGETRTVRFSFLASAAGILFAFAVLAAALIGLKQAGAVIGWGIQFQQPWFLVMMTIIVVAFACNLWGLFDIRLPQSVAGHAAGGGDGHHLAAHFVQGAFATLLATPCSAPFLGTAVGFALARGPVEIMAVFLALGLGLALPYLVVALVPTLATRMPKPGPWMVTLRRILGVLLAATGVWLLTVLAQNSGFHAAAAVGAIAAALAMALYHFHHAHPDHEDTGRPAALLAVATAAALLVPSLLAPEGAGAGPSLRAARNGTSELDRLWVPFDEAAIPRLVADGKTVFVDVTAEWCLTCQVNKAFVLAGDAVVASLKRDNVIVMLADWTRPDAAIAAFLARHGRYAIPFDAVFGPGAPDGVVLPELLREDAVLKAIARADGTDPATDKTARKAD